MSYFYDKMFYVCLSLKYSKNKIIKNSNKQMTFAGRRLMTLVHFLK